MPDRPSRESRPNIGGVGFGARNTFGNAGRWMQGGEKPRNPWGTLRRLWGTFGAERPRFMLVFLGVSITSALELSIPYLLGEGIDAIAALETMDTGIASLYPLLAVYGLDAVMVFVNSYIMAGVSQGIVKRLRTMLFDRIQGLPIPFFDTNTHGEIMSRFTNDIDNVSASVSQSTTQLMSSAILITGSLVMMLAISPPLTAAALITVPMVFLLTKTIAGRTRALFRAQQRILGALNGNIEETISGLDVVRAFGKEEDVIRAFEAHNTELCGVGIKAQLWSGFLMPLMNVINNVGFACVACVGGILALKGYVTIGAIASFIAYSKQFTRPLNEVANTFNGLQTAIAGAERVFDILDMETETDAPGAREPGTIRGDVAFESVCFGYDPGNPVLREVSFEAPAGSHIALVGPTGAGKTTIVSLLMGFYDATGGRILIDGVDVRGYRRGPLRDLFGMVLQDTYLFSGTIRENIRYGRLDATDDEVVAAAVKANADAFIRRLPKGYDTPLIDGGSNLSQGQRQLLSMARVILSDPAILILDEATSSVDTRTELHIQEAMLKLMEGRTAFVIAHRLSTIRDADRILVIDGGRIVEEGTHNELMEAGGTYARMYEAQFRRLVGEGA